MPETVGLILLTTVGAEAIAGTAVIGSLTVGSIVGSAALAGAAIGLQALTAQNAPSPTRPTDGRQAIRQGDATRRTGYGIARLSGPYMLYEVNQSTRISYDIIALHTGKLEEIIQYYLDDDVAIIDSGGGVQPGADGRFGSSVATIGIKMGLDTETVHGAALLALPSIWTSAHRGDGIASVLLICTSTADPEQFAALYPKNALPKPSVVAKLSAIFDPRDVNQVRTNKSTWQWSANPVVQIVDFLCGARNVNAHVNGRFDFFWADAIAQNLNHWKQQADICDELIAKKDGSTERRYESHLWWNHSTDPADTLARMLAACDGWLVMDGDGAIWPWVGKYQAPPAEATITDAHILGYSIAYGVREEEAVNEIAFSWTAPGNDYKETPGQPLRNETDISDRGAVRTEPVDLTQVQSHSQARRLIKRRLARHNAEMRGTLLCTLAALPKLKYRWLPIQYAPHDDLADIVVERGKARIDLAAGTVAFDWVLVDTGTIDDWVPASDEGDPPPFPDKVEQAPLPVPTLLATESRDSSTAVVSFANNGFPVSGDMPAYYRVRRRAFGVTEWAFTSGLLEAAIAPGTSRKQIDVPVTNFGHDEVEIAAVGTGPGQSDWSATLDLLIANPPDQASELDVNESGGVVTVTFNMPATSTLHAARVYFGTGGFGDADDVSGPLFGDLLEEMTFQHSPGSGTWNVFVTTEHSGGTESNPAVAGTVVVP